MTDEAPLKRTDTGVIPDGDGWFVLNARDARWHEGPGDRFTRWDEERRFEQFGIGLAVLGPGQITPMYHRESSQEAFLVVAGECTVLVEEQERVLKAWDFFHCAPWTGHVFVGTSDEPCVMVCVGARPTESAIFPVSDLALRFNAGVARETTDGAEAYAGLAPYEPTPYRDGWLAD